MQDKKGLFDPNIETKSDQVLVIPGEFFAEYIIFQIMVKIDQDPAYKTTHGRRPGMHGQVNADGNAGGSGDMIAWSQLYFSPSKVLRMSCSIISFLRRWSSSCCSWARRMFLYSVLVSLMSLQMRSRTNCSSLFWPA